MTNRLQWDVLVSAQIPVLTSDLPPAAFFPIGTLVLWAI